LNKTKQKTIINSNTTDSTSSSSQPTPPQPQPTTTSSTTSSSLPHLLAGGCAGLTTTAILHPLDSIKVRFQVYEGKTGVLLLSKTPNTITTAETLKYKTTWNFFKHSLMTKGGLRSLYSGVIPSLIANTASWGLYFGLYEETKKTIQNNYSSILTTANNNSNKYSTLRNGISAIVAGCGTIIIVNPLWLLKTRMQLEQTHSKRILYAIQDIFRTEGIGGFFRGLIPALLLTSNGAVQLVTYENLKKYHREVFIIPSQPLVVETNKKSGKFYEHMVMGGISKMVASGTTYPFQVIKTRMQQSPEHLVPAYQHTLTTIQSISKHEGILGFYKGLGPNLLRVVPSSALMFGVYEFVYQILIDSM
jgi:solute carrier family 25 folate transporter 32